MSRTSLNYQIDYNMTGVNNLKILMLPFLFRIVYLVRCTKRDPKPPPNVTQNPSSWTTIRITG